MTWITDRNRDAADDIAASLNGAVKHLRAPIQVLRDRADAQLPLASQDVREAFQRLASTRHLMEQKVVTPGLAAAYQRRFPDFGTFDPVAEWPALRAAIDSLVTWLKNAMPKDGDGNLALERPNATTNEIEGYDITLTAAQYSAVVTRFDTLLNEID